MHRRLGLSAFCLAVLLGGCVGQANRLGAGDQIRIPPGSISSYQLARELGMEVEDPAPCATMLRDGTNVVVIYPDPGGEIYVNGASMRPAGGVRNVADTLYVPGSVVNVIRPALRARPTESASISPADYASPGARAGRVVIDPGHGGRDPGAISVLGFKEKVITLSAALELDGVLRDAGVDTLLTRRSDVYVSLEERADIANRNNAGLFVSLHADSAGNPSAEGFTVYVARSASPASIRLATSIERRLSALGLPSRGVRQADYRVLVRTRCPAVLVELGYLSNRREAAWLAQHSTRQMLARAIGAAIVDYLGI